MRDLTLAEISPGGVCLDEIMYVQHNTLSLQNKTELLSVNLYIE